MVEATSPFLKIATRILSLLIIFHTCEVYTLNLIKNNLPKKHKASSHWASLRLKQHVDGAVALDVNNQLSGP